MRQKKIVMIHKSERWKSNQRKNLVKKKKMLGQREGRIEILRTLTNQKKEMKKRKKKEINK